MSPIDDVEARDSAKNSQDLSPIDDIAMMSPIDDTPASRA
jgi:hypothetical protein